MMPDDVADHKSKNTLGGLQMNDHYEEHDLFKATEELAKHSKISINLEGWPAAITCSLGITGITAIILTNIIKR